MNVHSQRLRIVLKHSSIEPFLDDIVAENNDLEQSLHEFDAACDTLTEPR